MREVIWVMPSRVRDCRAGRRAHVVLREISAPPPIYGKCSARQVPHLPEHSYVSCAWIYAHTYAYMDAIGCAQYMHPGVVGCVRACKL